MVYIPGCRVSCLFSMAVQVLGLGWACREWAAARVYVYDGSNGAGGHVVAAGEAWFDHDVEAPIEVKGLGEGGKISDEFLGSSPWIGLRLKRWRCGGWHRWRHSASSSG